MQHPVPVALQRQRRQPQPPAGAGDTEPVIGTEPRAVERADQQVARPVEEPVRCPVQRDAGMGESRTFTVSATGRGSQQVLEAWETRLRDGVGPDSPGRPVEFL